MTSDVEALGSGLEILTKANAVVIALESGGDSTAQEIAQNVGEPLSSTYRLLQSLLVMDWIEPAAKRGTYRLGVYFMRVGGRCEDRLDVRREAYEPLLSLQRQTGWASFLFIRRGLRAVCVERFDGASVRSMDVQIGDSLPLDRGAGALALLAFLPPGEQRGLVRQLVAAPRTDPAAGPARSDDEVLRLLDQTRRRGHARSDGEVTTGIADLAAPVFNHRGELAASVALSGLRTPLLAAEQELTRSLLAQARAVSRLLGDERE